MRLLTSLATATLVLMLGGTAAQGATGLPIPTASPAALNAANELMREPWPSLQPMIMAQAKAGMAGLDKDFVAGKGNSGDCLKFSYGLGFANLKPLLSLPGAPGFTSAGPGGFSVRAPLSGGWTFGAQGDFAAHVYAKAACRKIVDASTSIPFSFRITNLFAGATVNLDSRDPAKPKLTSGTISVGATFGGGNVLVPQTTAELQFTRGSDGILTASLPLASGSFKVAKVGIEVKQSLVVQLLPFTAGFAGEAIVPGVADLSVGGKVIYAVLALKGGIAVHLPSPLKSVSLDFDEAPLALFPIPVPRELGETLIALATARVPATWPPATSSNPLGIAQAPPGTLDFSSVRDTLERGIAATHMPYGTVLSLDAPGPLASRAGRNVDYTYGLDADSMIWTGHYLAAESFRYASTGSADALQRVQALLKGITRNFDETSDAIVAGPNKIFSTVDSGAPGAAGNVFARSVMPKSDKRGWTESADRRLGKQCLYVTASGWERKGKRYPTLARLIQGSKLGGGRLLGVTEATPIDPVYGSGCGSADSDHPISRDQYSGLFMGLAFAYQLVPEARADVKRIVDRALGYVLSPQHPWNVPLPPDGLSRTTFIGDFDAQIALLRIGATVDPEKFGDAYNAVKDASALTWIPVWFSTIDPIVSYYKFNLGHAFLGPPLFLESDATVRQNLLAAYNILRAPTAAHRNAWFNLVDILTGAASVTAQSASNPALTIAAETKSDLNDWVTRWTLVKNPNGDNMPTNMTSTTAGAALASLWPSNVAGYANPFGGAGTFAKLPLPVYDRPGNGMDFVWQKSPFNLGLDPPGSKRKVNGQACGTTPPSAAQLAACSTDTPLREGPGVDFLLPYWLAVYLKVLSSP
jgi:hypothetical protein